MTEAEFRSRLVNDVSRVLSKLDEMEKRVNSFEVEQAKLKVKFSAIAWALSVINLGANLPNFSALVGLGQ